MRGRITAVIASAAAVAAVLGFAVVSPFSGDSPRRAPPEGAAGSTGKPAPPVPVATGFGGVGEDCSTRSEAQFPGAFSDPRNLVVGPLVLVGGAYTDPSTVREFGGNKFPLLVAAGHTATVRIVRPAPTLAGLAYGPLPQGQTRLRDTHRTVTFVACRPGRASGRYSPDGPSGSYADAAAVTFWSGFVATRAPACIALDVYLDDERSPRRIGLSLGRRCPR
jgi:hypothetical protein